MIVKITLFVCSFIISSELLGIIIAVNRLYDAKNMMHTFRLLNMAEEIAIHQRVIVKREDREFLLKIRSGEFEFDYLMEMVEDKMDHVKTAYEKSALPDQPDRNKAESILVEIRTKFYQEYANKPLD